MTEYVTIKNPRPGRTPGGWRDFTGGLRGDGYDLAAEVYEAIADALENPPAAAPEPRPIAFEDIKAGMRVRRVSGETAVEFVVAGPIVGGVASSTDGPLWLNLSGCTWFVLSEPPEPDADLIEAMARAIHEGASCAPWDTELTARRNFYRISARQALAALREHEAKQ